MQGLNISVYTAVHEQSWEVNSDNLVTERTH